MAKIVLLEAQPFSFSYDDEMGTWFYNAFESPPILTVGETYQVVWDGETHTCVAQDVNALMSGFVAIGNLSAWGLEGNDEPFIIGSNSSMPLATVMALNDTEPSTHTVGVYQTETDKPEESVGIVLKDYKGNEQIYEGVEKVKLNTSDGGTQIFSKGDTVGNVLIDLDFTQGNQTINAPDGCLVKSATIIRPTELIPENIVKGIKIAGVLGKYEGGGGAHIRYVTFMNGETELTKYPVIVGDTCRDVVTLGIIDAPTKEPTISTVYSFGGWSLTDDGTADSDALTNVTEDRTVYLVFKAEPRKYTVNFYDGETLVHTEQVAYGGSSTYRYEKEGYLFGGWTPKPTNITGDMNCYAQFVESIAFASASWSEIAYVVENGLAEQMWSVGDTKNVKIDGTSRRFRIVAFDHDDLADGTGKAKITLMQYPTYAGNLIDADDYPFHSSKTATNWKSCSFRTTTIPEFLSTMDEDLQKIIKPVTKKYCAYESGSVKTLTTTDKLWIPSCREVGCTTNNYGDTVYSVSGTQYAYISDPRLGLTSTSMRYYTRDMPGTTSNNAVYWDANSSKGASIVSTSVVPTQNWANPAYHVLGFCI